MKTQMTITLNQIRKHNPCADGWSKVLKANGGAKADFDKEFPVSSILGSNGLDDTLWVLRCLPEYESLCRKFAWWSANQVVDNAKDKRVNRWLKVVRSYSDGLATDEELLDAQSELNLLSSMESPWGILKTTSEALLAVESALSAVESVLSVPSLPTILAARLAARSAESLAATSTWWSTALSATSSAAGSAAIKAARSAAWLEARSAQEAMLRNLLDTGKWKD